MKIRTLIIDDNEIIRIFFRDVFWLHGLEDRFELEVADGVETGLKIIHDPEKRPDILFLDLVMPFKSPDGKIVTSPEAGLSILKEIKSDPVLKIIKVFVFSSFSGDDSKKQAMDLGADKFLVKEDHLPQDLVKVLEDYARENCP